MPIVENGKAVLRDAEGTLKLVPADQAASAISRFGWAEATKEDIEADDLEKSAGGLGGQEVAAHAGLQQTVLSGAAAAYRGIDAVGDAVMTGLGLDPVGPDAQSVTGQSLGNKLYGNGYGDMLYGDKIKKIQGVNPGSTMAGRVLPAIIGSVVAPSGLALGLGLDLATGASTEALDAELEHRDIQGWNILENGGINAAFTLGGAGSVVLAGKARELAVNTAEAVGQRAAKFVSEKAERYGVARLEKKAADVVEGTASKLDSLPLPKIANNPNAQRDALEELVDSYTNSHPAQARDIDAIIKGSGKSRYNGLLEVRDTLPVADDSLRSAIDETLKREDLWGSKVVSHVADLEAVKGMVPGPSWTPQGLTEYAAALRKVGGKEFQKSADLLDEFAQTKAVGSLMGPAAEAAGSFVGRKVAGKGVNLASRAVGASSFGWPGYFAGQAVGSLLEPVADKLGKDFIEPFAQKKFLQTLEGLKAYAENDTKMTARLMVNPDMGSKVSRIVGDIPSTFRLFQGDDATPEQAFQRHRDNLQAFKLNPLALTDRLEEEFGQVSAQSPKLHREMAEQAFKISAFLQEKMPKPRGVSVARPNGTPPSPLEMRQYALFAMSATDPGSVMADAKAGRLRREQVETLQRLWPGRYNALRNAVVEQLGQGSTTVTRQRMNLLFGFKSSIDPALGPTVTAMVNAARDNKGAPKSAAAPGIQSAKPPSSSSMTPGGQASMQLGDTMRQ
jgi:hypothetical protein